MKITSSIKNALLWESLPRDVSNTVLQHSLRNRIANALDYASIANGQVPRMYASERIANIHSLWSRANRKMYFNKPEEAEPILREILALSPHNTSALNRLGISLAESDRTKDAIKIFKKLSKVEPCVEAFHNLGVAYYKEAMYQQALVAFNKAVRYHPTEAKRYVAVAKVSVKLNHPSDAIRSLSKAYELKHKTVFLMMLHSVYTEYGMNNEAQDTELKIIEQSGFIKKVFYKLRLRSFSNGIDVNYDLRPSID